MTDTVHVKDLDPQVHVKDLEHQIAALRLARDSWIDRCRKAEKARDLFKSEMMVLQERGFNKKVRPVTLECMWGNTSETSVLQIAADAKIVASGGTFDVKIQGATEDYHQTDVKMMIVGMPEDIG